MEKKQATEFSWTGLFMVTAGCFFVFSGLIKLLNGSPAHAGLFFKTGVVSLVLWSVSLISNGISDKPSLKKSK
jgi:hypothetical protein